MLIWAVNTAVKRIKRKSEVDRANYVMEVYSQSLVNVVKMMTTQDAYLGPVKVTKMLVSYFNINNFPSL